MTADTDVCEISKSEIEDKCGLDMITNQDLPKVGADCNGSTKLTDANVNVSGDSDSSYVLVDEVTADPLDSPVVVVANNNCKSCLTTSDVEIQVEENGGNVECCLVESDCIVVGESKGEGVVVDAARSDDVVEEVNGSAVMEVVEPVCVDCEAKDEEVVELESSPKTVESEESQMAVIEPVVEVEEVREPVIGASKAGGAMARPEAESNLELSAELGESHASEKNVLLEADGGELPEVEEVGEVELEEQPELTSDGQLKESFISHLASRSSSESAEEKLVEENRTEIDVGIDQNLESSVVVTAEVQSDARPENEVADLAIETTAPLETEAACGSALSENQASQTEQVDIPTDGSQIGTQLTMGSEDAHFLPSTDCVRPETEKETKVPLEAETAGDPASNTDQASKTEEVSKCVLKNLKDTQLKLGSEDSQVLPSADCVRSETENEAEVRLETETLGDHATKEIQASKEEDINKCVNESQNDIQLNEGPENAQILSSTDCVGSETDNESEMPSETETASHPTPSENQASQIEEVSKCLDESQKGTLLNDGSEDAQTLPSVVCVRLETDNETEVPLETETASKQVSNEKAQILPSADCVRSESNDNGDMAVENGGNFHDGPDDGRLLDKEVGDGASLITENVPAFSTDNANHGTEIGSFDDRNSEDGLCSAPNSAKSEIEVENGSVGVDAISTCPDKRVSLETGIEFGSVGPREKAPILWCDDVELEMPNGDTEPINGSAPGYEVSDSGQNGNLPELKRDCEVELCSAISSRDLLSNGAVVPTSETLDSPVGASEVLDGSVGGTESVLNSGEKIADDQKVGDELNEDVVIDGVQSDEMPTSLPESAISDATDGQDVDTEVLTRPFRFLIKIPRFEDEKLREQIRHAQLQVDEKTQRRDAIRAEIHMKRANCQAHGERFEAAKAEERAARRLVKLKRQEIDSVQSVINRVKNAISVEDIDTRIYSMEHMIQHETLPLKEEKEFIREIKRLKHLREQLSSNMGSQDEVQQALDQKDQNEERLKILKKELETLKDRVLKAEAVKISAGKKYDDESKRLKELQAQAKAANDVRQETYEHLSSLRRQLNEKHKNFRLYKDDVAAANGYASHGDKEALHRLCLDQVEQLMGLWNTDDEFRKEYVRCNMRSTVRRLRTLDGRSLGFEEEPLVLPSYVDERVVRRLVSIPSQAKSISMVATVEQEKQVSSAEDKQAGGKSTEKVVEQKSQTVKTQETAKPTVVSGSATVSGRDENEEDRKDEEKIQTREEQELARKAEELKEAEIEAELKEQRRLEEKTKAKEALERKKRNAEKAQMRAELRAQKEAEEKEKEREKRLRKKEKKKSVPGDVAHEYNSNGEDAATSGITIATISKESEVKESNSISTSKKPQKPSTLFIKQSKPKAIPPPLRNRGKRRMQQWLWMISVVVVVLALFLLGNTGFFLNLRLRKAAGTF